MELVNEFVVNKPVDETWPILTDLERIAPCMPGAQLTEIEGDLLGVEEVKDRDVVLAEPEMLEAATEVRRFNEEVGNDDDQGALADGLGQFVQDRDKLGLTVRLDLV